MISLETIPFSKDCLKRIEESVLNYWRMARIEVSAATVGSSEGKVLIDVTLHQKELVNDRILTSDELIARGQGIFEGCVPEGYNLRFNPITYN